ncbi:MULTISPECIES: ethanolamine ammonia-lyase subunit EutC [Bradyrhizobium]|uniref:ethanolamine ammonia-lyase subunit EutC n=1 Tax=Bradyrhizobium TaxID=374 RepID=UPI00005DCCB1|nr:MULTISPECIES: ethanolamine ammonia-lyase subunit EutC [Bradyrhizobium]ABQ35816.1 Ethanolamine ammonia-lyase light chain [Bradyrhizobium sp. BTAi1]MCL8484252.1 ethanolamine ammonia-lyase subunit EutC [Bradyrhizobium denitrificans]RTL96808.1 MAG: ethanolamine ammonia-lyase subunit EutC [Bradyrhizobiaceae bacterium]
MSETDDQAPATSSSDDWSWLSRYTAARIALGRCGPGLPTSAHLGFQAAHAEARDAVLKPFDAAGCAADVTARGWPAIVVRSRAADRATYLQRPDAGRLLAPDSEALLSEPRAPADIALVVADGLSSRAVQVNALPVLDTLMPLLAATGRRLSPIIVAAQGRVALADHVGELFDASASIILIGERPGLSAADSLGLYLTWMPRRGRVDSERNCISNVRHGGLAPEDAAKQAAELIARMFKHRAAGVSLARLPQLPAPDGS